MSFLDSLISGISLGSVYAIIALGYTMVYGIAKMLNFAHGDVIMVGAYICFFAVTRFNLPPLVGILVAVLLCTVLGITIEKLAYAPLRSAPSLAVLITAIGVSYFLQNAALLLWSPNPKVFPNFFMTHAADGAEQTGLELGSLRISYVTLVTIVVCVVIMAVLTFFINNGKLGKAMRAVSEDKDAARLMGINVNTTISVTFAIGSGLAAIAGAVHVRVPDAGADHRLHARYQGVHRGGVRRHRLHPRGVPRRTAAGRHRDLCQGLYLHPALRRGGVRRADHRAAGEALRPSRQGHPGESVRWRT